MTTPRQAPPATNGKAQCLAGTKLNALGYLVASGLPTLLIFGNLWTRDDLDPFAVVLLLVTGVYFLALTLGRGPSVWAALLSTAGFAYYYAPPTHSFLVNELDDAVTLVVMSSIAIATSHLVEGYRTQTENASRRERMNRSLFRLALELSQSLTTTDVARTAIRQTNLEFRSKCVILLPDQGGTLVYPKGKPRAESLHGANLNTAQWVFNTSKPAGKGTNTLADEPINYLPLACPSGVMGVLAMAAPEGTDRSDTERKLFFESYIQQIALALERVKAIDAAALASLRVEQEMLRNTLLSSISHDLRTPITGIFGAACVLSEKRNELSADDQSALITVIRNQSQRMSQLTDKILDMIKLSGEIAMNKEWHAPEDLFARSLRALGPQLEHHKVNVSLPEHFCPVFVDATLIQQVLVNLLENAIRYSPPNGPIDLVLSAQDQNVSVRVEDRGPGIPAGSETRIFDKFVTIPVPGAPPGVGLGLNICKIVVEAHGGSIRAENRAGGGACFHFDLPNPEAPPSFDLESDF